MIPVSYRQIAEAVGAPVWGVWQGAGEFASHDGELTGQVVHDSRRIQPGDLYIALTGETHNGHDFALSAIERGASALVISDDLAAHTWINELPDSVAVFPVPSTLIALGRLANLVLSQAPNVSVIAVTGSSGKTSVKDLLAQLFAAHGPTIAPPGSFNNEIGLPMTVLQVTDDTKYLILEMGARGIGHIQTLTQIAPPLIGVELNVGSAHAGEFGSIAGTKQAKQELVAALPVAGVAILNADDPNVVSMASATKARVVSFGGTAEADVRVENVMLDSLAQPSFELVVGTGIDATNPASSRHKIALPLAGAHSAHNAAAAAATALAAGISAAAIAQTLATVKVLSPGRMNVTRAADGLTVIDDSYNANVESMRAGLKALAQAGRGRTTWAVLGEMRELGDASVMAHDEIGRAVVRLGIDNLIVIGENARPMFLAAAAEGFYNGEARFADTIMDAEIILEQYVKPEDVVFIKASRAAQLDQLAASLLARHNASGEAQ